MEDTIPVADGLAEAGNGEQHVGPEIVHFMSCSPSTLKEAAQGRTLPGVEVTARLFLPSAAPDNLPAVVISHGLGGVKPERELTYARKLAKAGCAALVVDGFAARGLADAPDAWKALRVETWALLADAFAGLRFLAGHPAINRDAIAIMGFSWGGMVSVLAAYEQIRTAYLGDDALRFAAHVSYYGCSVPRMEDPHSTGAPVLMLVGKHDANVSIERSRQICADLRRGGSRAELRVYDAFHQWDGKDVEMRHVQFALAGMRVVITRDGESHNENSGSAITGRLTHAWMVLRDVSFRGYDILRDEDVHAKTDRALIDFLDREARDHGARPLNGEHVPYGAIDIDHVPGG